MVKTKFKSIYFLKLLRTLFVLIGIFFSTCVLLALTEQPFWAYHWLGTSKSELNETPKTIIVLGGGGMPSQSNLMRSWYAGVAAQSFPKAQVLIAMPGESKDSLSTPQAMKEELLMREISQNRIVFENKGTNTRSQALYCLEKLGSDNAILLITSPEHMRRAVLCFTKVGFTKVYALPAFENALEANLNFDDDALGGNKTLLPDVGESINMRYQLWNHLKYEILVIREIMALSYYRLRGWI
jgi:uncharacterized SAM-binding protein YcdF (DUF218 family)